IGKKSQLLLFYDNIMPSFWPKGFDGVLFGRRVDQLNKLGRFYEHPYRTTKIFLIIPEKYFNWI
ncbi:MAG: hypothetical protein DIU64_000825, partial [Caldicoprobacter oshimai]